MVQCPLRAHTWRYSHHCMFFYFFYILLSLSTCMHIQIFQSRIHSLRSLLQVSSWSTPCVVFCLSEHMSQSRCLPHLLVRLLLSYLLLFHLINADNRIKTLFSQFVLCPDWILLVICLTPLTRNGVCTRHTLGPGADIYMPNVIKMILNGFGLLRTVTPTEKWWAT